jgi:large subunit ribosomal protein L10
MNREQKAVAIAEIAGHIDEAEAIFAVDYRGISVAQVAELRSKLRDADATFKVVKNSLTERAADQAGAESLKEYLAGPTALTFVRGDIALAAKAVADYARVTQMLPFKGGLMGGSPLDVEQIRSLSRLPSREVLYGQLVGVVASPVSGLVRSLGGLLGGLAVALGQVREKKESGEIGSGPAGPPPAEVSDAQATSETSSDAAGTAVADTASGSVEAAPAAEGDAGDRAGGEAAADEADVAAAEAPEEGEPEAAADESAAPEAAGATTTDADSEAGGETDPQPHSGEDADSATDSHQADNQQADVSDDTEDAETSPKED